MVDPISDYISPISPLPNIAPFTYKDGETYLTTLENFRVYVNTTLVTFINTNFGLFNDTFTTEINNLITEVNGILATQTASIDDAIATVNAAVATVNTAVTAAQAAETAAAASAATASASDTSASASAAAAAASAADAASHALGDGDVAGFVTDTGSATHSAILGIIPPSGDVVAVVAGTNVSVDNTDPTHPIVSSTAAGGTTVVAGTNIAVNNTDPTHPVVSTPLRERFTEAGDYTSIPTYDPVTGDAQVVIVDTIPNALFVKAGDPTHWTMLGIPGVFTDLAAIEAAITAPVEGTLAAATDIIYKYYDNGNGVGWYPWSSGWIYFTPTTGVGSNFTGYTLVDGFVAGRKRYKDGDIFIEMALKMGASDTMGSLYCNISDIISGIIPAWNADTNFTGVQYQVGSWIAKDNTTFNTYDDIVISFGATTNFYPAISGASTGINGTTPFTWTAGSTLVVEFKVTPV